MPNSSSRPMPNGNGTGSGSGGKLTEMISRVTTSTPSSARIGASSGVPFSTSGRTAMRSVAQPTTIMKATTTAIPSG
jgi:hypothetical protein